jgi:hypothetical protein
VLALCLAQLAQAAEIDTGTDVQLRWDTTLRTSLGVRTSPQDPALLRNSNADDGDRAFNPGLMSERLDVLSELDLQMPETALGEIGIGASADGWYDAAYQGRTANRSPATFNPISVPNTRFPQDVQVLEGRDAELLTASVHDRFMVDDTPVTIRLGRQTLLWGESLFSTENGIAAGQAPVDGIKALSQPLAEAKELFLPVTQAMAELAPRPGLSLQTYVQLEWRPNRLPGVGSYFSTSDILDVGGERLLDGNSAYLRTQDRRGQGLGQFGTALKLTTGDIDLGLYALRFDAKSPQIFVVPNGLAQGPILGRYGLLYPRGIDVFGGSFSTFAGDSNVAGEMSVRLNMPLVSHLPALAAQAAPADAALPYARGTTLHAQMSSQTTLPPSAFWQGATAEAELTANSVLAVTRDPAARAPGRQTTAASLRLVFTPQYFQVLPQLDMSIPVGVAYDILGSSAVLADQSAHAGNAELALNATWRTVWTAALTYTHFLGSPAHQPLADRNFVLLALTRTF